MSSQIIYSIDNSKIKAYHDLETNKVTGYNTEPEHELDLVNCDTHFSDGTIKKAENRIYNMQLLTKAKRVSPPEKVRQLLQHHLKYHLSQGGTQIFYFSRLKDLVEFEHSGHFKDKPSTKEIILRWIAEESTDYDKKIFFDTTFNERESKYQCPVRKYDIKDYSLTSYDLVDNAFKQRYIENDIFNYFDEIEKFLEHHYKWYHYDKKEWLKHTERIIKEYKALHYGKGKDEARHNHALEWIVEKREPVQSTMNKKERIFYKIPHATTSYSADSSFIGTMRTDVNPDFSIHRVKDYLQNHFEESGGNNVEQQQEWLGHTKDLIISQMALKKVVSDKALEWVAGKQQEINHAKSAADDEIGKRIITEKQQGLIIYYLQNYLKKIDRTQNDLQLARFFAFFLNKNPKEIKDWRVYKTILNPLYCKEGKSITALQKDLETIKEHFHQLGQAEIVAQIEKDIEKIHNK